MCGTIVPFYNVTDLFLLGRENEKIINIGGTMVKYEDLYFEVKSHLSEKRFHHCEAVVKRALEYAEVYHVPCEIVRIVAIAHDIAKELTDQEIEKYLYDYHIELDEVEKLNKNLLHAKVGACLCKEKYQFTDDMVNAVRYHTTGRANMSMLEKIIYLADSTEENRKHSSCYASTIKSDIDRGMVEVSKWVIQDLLQKNKIIHLDSVKCYNYYNEQLEKPFVDYETMV